MVTLVFFVLLGAGPPAELDVADKAYRAGDASAAVTALSSLLSKRGTDAEDVDAELARRGLPPAGEILAQSRLAAMRIGQSSALPLPGRTEMLLMVPHWHAELAADFELAGRMPALTGELPRPESMAAFEALLESFPKIASKLDGLSQMLDEYEALASKTRTQLVRRDRKAAKIVDKKHIDELRQQLEGLQREFREREIELRIARVKKAGEVLDEPGVTRERMLAAATWKRDLAAINRYAVEARRDKPSRKALAAPKALSNAADAAKAVGRRAGSLTDKAEAFVLGLSWWRRGRYGAGPMHGGMVKYRAALGSPATAYALLMPREKPLPRDPLAKQQPSQRQMQSVRQPQYPRRHLMWWTWSDRRVNGLRFQVLTESYYY